VAFQVNKEYVTV